MWYLTSILRCGLRHEFSVQICTSYILPNKKFLASCSLTPTYGVGIRNIILPCTSYRIPSKKNFFGTWPPPYGRWLETILLYRSAHFMIFLAKSFCAWPLTPTPWEWIEKHDFSVQIYTIHAIPSKENVVGAWSPLTFIPMWLEG